MTWQRFTGNALRLAMHSLLRLAADPVRRHPPVAKAPDQEVAMADGQEGRCTEFGERHVRWTIHLQFRMTIRLPQETILHIYRHILWVERSPTNCQEETGDNQ